MTTSPVDLWRLADAFTVVDAAILICGNDPSERDTSGGWKDGTWPQRIDYHGFEAALAALKAAILRGQLPAQLCYRTANAPIGGRPTQSSYLVYGSSELQGILPSTKVVFDGGDTRITIAQEPVWSDTLLEVTDLRVWLKSRGHTGGFFFPESEVAEEPTCQTASEDFMDSSHPHFAPELAMAVSAWRALADKTQFKSSEKKAILDWIEKNPQAWLSAAPPSKVGIERIATLVNWNTTGGAPPTKS